MHDARFRIPDLGIARAAQALASRVALSFFIKAKILNFVGAPSTRLGSAMSPRRAFTMSYFRPELKSKAGRM